MTLSADHIQLQTLAEMCGFTEYRTRGVFPVQQSGNYQLVPVMTSIQF